MTARKWLSYLAFFLFDVGFAHHLVVQAIRQNAWLWSFGIAATVAAVIGIGNLAVDLYIRHAHSIFE
jgi:hypothetical protein